jgi:hypothetical protein
MEVTAAHHCLASIVGLCCQILFSLKIMNYTCNLKATVPFPIMDMKSSGPHRPLVRHLHFVRGSGIGKISIRYPIENTITATLLF